MNTAFERTSQKEEWLTPKFILDALGPFDLDPCASVVRPWHTAQEHYTREDNGLLKPWHGFVWCNPPYGTQTGKWLARMAEHNNGIALTFARTETDDIRKGAAFFVTVWPHASAMLFLRGRLSFCDTTGKPIGTAGAPSVLIGYGPTAYKRLVCSALDGAFVKLQEI